MSSKLLSRLQQLGASPAALSGLKSVLPPAQPHAPHAVIVRRSEPATHLHVVEEGWACCWKGLRDGRRQIIAVGLDGDVPDVDALALGSCSFQVTAVSHCHVARIPLAALRFHGDEEKSLAVAFQRLAALDNRVATEWIVNLGRRSAAERIAHLICEWAVRLDAAPSSKAVKFDSPLTQADLADATGLSNVHVNRNLQMLRNELGLHFDRRHVSIDCWENIVRFAEFDAEYLCAPSQANSSSLQRQVG